jgi:CheY-like chemotaxis protein
MSKRILVVEDQLDTRRIIRDMLASTDYEVAEAENGEEALAAIAKQRPDLILMDVQLPIMDVTPPRAGSRPIRRCDRSRSSRSRPMRSTVRREPRGRPAAMTTCPNHLARANSWQKSASICPRLPIICCSAECPLLAQSGHHGCTDECPLLGCGFNRSLQHCS